jgi:DNA polymerase
MSYVVLDFETFFDTTKGPDGRAYSLRGMTPPEYILDPRFEAIGCAVVEGDDGVPFWLDRFDLVLYLSKVKTPVISHNALFDMCLLHWRFGTLPPMMIDTQGMARALLFHKTGYVSLDKVCMELGLPPKDGDALRPGYRRQDYIANGVYDRLIEYAKQDVWKCREIFKRLRGQFPRTEFEIMDMVIRCAVDPKFVLDANLLAEHKFNIEQQKDQLLMRCGIMDKKQLMSNEKFAEALRMVGVKPPEKVSPTTGEITYAFAKSDPAMVELAEDERPEVQALIAARTGHKSTLEESRTARLLSIANLQWPGRQQGLVPIPLRYGAAHTHRLGGDWKLNPQNWPKYTNYGDGTKVTGKLRMAHKAPPGYLVVKADASQIEARIVAWLAGQTDLVQAFREGRDIYSEFAEAEIYHYPVSKGTVDERFVGKNTILGAGFGMGPAKFRVNVAAVSYVTLGRAVEIDAATAELAIGGYRRRYPRIPSAWKACNNVIPRMARDPNCSEPFGPITFEYQRIRLPPYPDGKSLFIYYDGLQWEQDSRAVGGGNWKFTYGKMPKKLFGGKVYENIVQSLARIITMSTAVRMRRRYPDIPLAHQVHDDLIYIVPEHMADEFRQCLEHEMAIGPDWAAGLPLASESAMGPSYGECK